jgi:hypothetical protein
MRAITWDIGIAAALGLLLAYTILIRKHKALATLMSVYMAYFVAASWGSRLSQLLSGDRILFNQVWIKGAYSLCIRKSSTDNLYLPHFCFLEARRKPFSLCHARSSCLLGLHGSRWCDVYNTVYDTGRSSGVLYAFKTSAIYL